MTDTEPSSDGIKKSVADWLLREDHSTAVADFQRPYTWSESHVTAFTQSLLDAMLHPEKGAPDIGVVVVEKTSDADFIVDGQQRLLTFALFVLEWYGKGILGRYKRGVKKLSRLRQLLETHNLQSTIHARWMRRIIRNVCQRSPEAQSVTKPDEKYQLLRSVTFSIVEFHRKEGETSNPAVMNFFEPLNTTAKPLNGGQILKAHHMGRICTNQPHKTWRLQSRYEAWFRGHEEDNDLGLNAFIPLSFNWGKEISIERFIDSHDQDAYYRLGCGFVQAVQAMLLGQDKWWWEIASQGGERQAPFDRLEGDSRNASGEGIGLKNDRTWRATEPLGFSEAEGFFRMVGRFARLYDAYCLELSGLTDEFPTEIQERITDRGLAEDDPDRRPARLVCKAARLMAAFGRCLAEWSEKEKCLQTEPALGRLCRWEKDRRIEIAPEFRNARAWLALPKKQDDLSNTYGSIPTAVYAAALLWSDKFPQREADDDIVRLLMTQLLFARPCSVWTSVWQSLSMPEVVAAAHFSTNSQGALWRFLKTARYMKTDWPGKLEETLAKMQEKLSQASSEKNSSPEKDAMPEEKKAVAELRTILSQYLSF